MSVGIATVDGNLTNAATFAVVDATSFLDAEVGNTLLTTSYQETSSFTPGAIEIDGLAVKIAVRAVSPSGTISVRLAQAGSLVAGTEVTINVSDIEARAAEQGWYLFRFAAPVTLMAATLYTLSAKTSASNQVNLWRNSTGANFARMLRTTTTALMGAGDSWHVLGEWTAAATKTDRAVTMDQTAATDYGSGAAISTTNPAGVTIGKGGTLSYGAAAATAYVLRLSTTMVVWQSGTFTMGTTGTPIPRDSTAVLEFDPVSLDGDFGLDVFGTWIAQGLSRTAGKNVVQCKLNTDEAIAQTVLGVDTDTGWLNGDIIAIASTSRTFGNTERATLNGGATATEITITAGLAAAHSGTSPTQTEIVLITRNVQIRSTSTTLMAYVHVDELATVDLDWVWFRYLGATGAGKRGVEVETIAGGSCTIDFCSVADFDNHGFFFTGAAATGWACRNCVASLVAKTAGQAAFAVSVATTGSWTMTDCTAIGGTGTNFGFLFNDIGGTVARCVAAGNGNDGFSINEPAGVTPATPWDALTAHSGNTEGIQIAAAQVFKATNLSAWRNSSSGLALDAYAVLVFVGVDLFGNLGQNIQLGSGALATGSLRLDNLVAAGDSSFGTNVGLSFPNGNNRSFPLIRIGNATFGVAAGIRVAHATADIQFQAGSPRFCRLDLNEVLLASATEFANKDQLHGRSEIRFTNVDQAPNVQRTEYPQLGTVTYDTSVTLSSPASERLTPAALASPGFRLESQRRVVPIRSGGTVAIAVAVQKDGSYVGSAPRLMMRANPALGFDTDVVVATHSAASGVWQTLAGTTAAAAQAGGVEFFVDCDGVAGNVYTDDWAGAPSA